MWGIVLVRSVFAAAAFTSIPSFFLGKILPEGLVKTLEHEVLPFDFLSCADKETLDSRQHYEHGENRKQDYGNSENNHRYRRFSVTYSSNFDWRISCGFVPGSPWGTSVPSKPNSCFQ